ncbi:unnamed protein product [Closterium sp. NIES-64]|nr:unnamed protein product [Closterium sp. NIES-64]
MASTLHTLVPTCVRATHRACNHSANQTIPSGTASPIPPVIHRRAPPRLTSSFWTNPANGFAGRAAALKGGCASAGSRIDAAGSGRKRRATRGAPRAEAVDPVVQFSPDDFSVERLLGTLDFMNVSSYSMPPGSSSSTSSLSSLTWPGSREDTAAGLSERDINQLAGGGQEVGRGGVQIRNINQLAEGGQEVGQGGVQSRSDIKSIQVPRGLPSPLPLFLPLPLSLPPSSPCALGMAYLPPVLRCSRHTFPLCCAAQGIPSPCAALLKAYLPPVLRSARHTFPLMYRGRMVTPGERLGTRVLLKAYPGREAAAKAVDVDAMAANELVTHVALQEAQDEAQDDEVEVSRNVLVLLGGFETSSGEKTMATSPQQGGASGSSEQLHAPTAHPQQPSPPSVPPSVPPTSPTFPARPPPFSHRSPEQWLVMRDDGYITAADYAKAASEATAEARAVGDFEVWDRFDPAKPLFRREIFIRKLLRGFLQGLSYMHSKGRLHQSIGPASVVLNTTNEMDVRYLVPRLRDFAFAIDISNPAVLSAGVGSAFDAVDEVKDSLWRRAASAGAKSFLERRSFGLADDIYAAGLLVAYMAFVPLCAPGAIDGPSLQRLLETTFSLNIPAAREYCSADDRYCCADDRWSNAVAFLDRRDGAGWELLQVRRGVYGVEARGGGKGWRQGVWLYDLCHAEPRLSPAAAMLNPDYRQQLSADSALTLLIDLPASPCCSCASLFFPCVSLLRHLALCSPMQAMLNPDYRQRPSADSALQHRFFDLP